VPDLASYTSIPITGDQDWHFPQVLSSWRPPLCPPHPVPMWLQWENAYQHQVALPPMWHKLSRYLACKASQGSPFPPLHSTARESPTFATYNLDPMTNAVTPVHLDRRSTQTRQSQQTAWCASEQIGCFLLAFGLGMDASHLYVFKLFVCLVHKLFLLRMLNYSDQPARPRFS